MNYSQLPTGQLLDILRNKGASWQTVNIADHVLEYVAERIQEHEYKSLKVAISHYRTGEGPEEFYTVINQLINKYKVNE